MRVSCDWRVVEHMPGAVKLGRTGGVVEGADRELAVRTAQIKKVGAGRRPARLTGIAVRLTSTWIVREELGDLLVLVPSAA